MTESTQVDDSKFDAFIKTTMNAWHHARNAATMNEDLEVLMIIVELQNEIIKEIADDFNPEVGQRLALIKEHFEKLSKK
jgi:hypothetical protein